MLTPQEVSERAFSKASFGGYNMSQVDEFLDILTGDYSALYNENAVLKSKMKVLVDKVEEYRSTEEAMRKALMTAQRMADDLVQEAEQKKAELLKTAEAEAAGRTPSPGSSRRRSTASSRPSRPPPPSSSGCAPSRRRGRSSWRTCPSSIPPRPPSPSPTRWTRRSLRSTTMCSGCWPRP